MIHWTPIYQSQLKLGDFTVPSEPALLYFQVGIFPKSNRMRKESSLVAALVFLFAGLCAIPAAGQVHSTQPDQISDIYQPFPLRQSPFYVEVNTMLNPVYIFQFSGKFRLDGHRLPIVKAYRPKFYATQPFQSAFSDLGETADQANSLYGSFYLTFLENSAIPFFHHIRFVFGATHEKLEGDSSQVVNTSKMVDYRYYDGGTEATFLLEKNIAYRLSTRQYQTTGIIFGINVQAGFFESVAKARTSIGWNGDVIKSINTNRWQWPSPRNGWGWMAGGTFEVGGLICHDYLFCPGFSRNCFLGRWMFAFCRRVGVSLATRLAVMELNSADGVEIIGGTTGPGLPGVARDKVSQGRLRINNYSLFFAGPILNLRWMNLN